MMRYLPSFRALAALEAVVRHGNIVKAADELGVTAGAVSKQLLNLQAALGAPLFEEGHRLEPTEVAIELAHSVGGALTQVRDAWSEASHKADTRVLTLTANASFCMHWLVPRVLAAQNALNGRPVRVTSLHTTDNWWDLPVDLAILRHHDVPAGWITQPVGSESLTLLATPERAARLAGRGVDALRDETFLVAGTRGSDLDNWLSAAGVTSVGKRQHCSHFYIALEGALAGVGLVVGPVGVVCDLIRQKRLCAPYAGILTEGAVLTGAYNSSTCNERTAERLFSWLRTELAQCSKFVGVDENLSPDLPGGVNASTRMTA